MRNVRKALLAAAVAVAFPTSGLATHVVTLALNIRSELMHRAEQVSHEQSRKFEQPGVRIRSAPGVEATVVGDGNPGERAEVHRAVDGSAVLCENGSNNSEWFEITNRDTSVTGYVSGCLL
ncbi:SH3 domain-containing protein [Saccharopolyspora sp. HNM0983]|uniref:SH3 domain-containing protein n=1 Tax=Saccharopolyspora montiporae TaxID=2781240 RepID=A0A929B9M8_9PSEU|nr:SH3 domain-containing protein [Saccharopolyspora sp. HNM0983]MBE9373976.1 SH3 domain-containing protein [Saccharopolyspora sp. HNM0983]